MFLSLWAPSRLSFSLINSRPPQSNRCYGSNPSKFVSSVKKQKALSQGPSWLFHILTACLQRNTESMNSRHGKQGPLDTAPQPPCHEANPLVVDPQVTSKTVTLKVTALFALWLLSRLFASLFHPHICGSTQSLLLFFIESSQVTNIPPCDVKASPHADTPTAEMIMKHGNNCGRRR